MKNVLVSHSILSADFCRLGEEVKKLESSGADMIHIDVMDGHFVPNITIGPPVVKSLKKNTNLPLDVHLMITDPEKFVPEFIKAGADIITFHIEATNHPQRLLEYIKSEGVVPGITVNPATPIDFLEYIGEYVDQLLIMTVNPGFGGQKFINSQLEKIKKARKILDRLNPSAKIEVDGGVNEKNTPALINAGVDILVAGNFIFSSNDYESKITDLKKAR